MSKAMVKRLLSIKSFDDVMFFQDILASRHPKGINNIIFGR